MDPVGAVVLGGLAPDRSLHMKLTLILLLLITSLMAVVGAFLTINVSNFFTNTFYQQIDSVFGADQREFVTSLRGEAEAMEVRRMLASTRAMTSRMEKGLVI